MRCVVQSDLSNYRPVYDLCPIVKILEKLVISQVSSNLNSHNIYNACHSACPPALKKTLMKVVDDLFLSLNKENISVLAMLDLSSAFDTIDNSIPIHRLHADIGFTDCDLQWFSSYLTDRTNYDSLSNNCFGCAHVHSCIPQGSVRGRMLLTIYIKPLSDIIDSHSIMHDSFAVDLQLQMSAPLIKYLSFFTQCSHVHVMSKLGQLWTCINLMTKRQSSCLSPLIELSIAIAYLIQSLSAMLIFQSDFLWRIWVLH